MREILSLYTQKHTEYWSICVSLVIFIQYDFLIKKQLKSGQLTKFNKFKSQFYLNF